MRLTNTGDRTGREVVQVYLRRDDSAIERPTLWLAGFAAVTAEPGRDVDVDVTLAARAFQHWCVETKRWRTEPGTFTVLAGSSSADLPLEAEVAVDG